MRAPLSSFEPSPPLTTTRSYDLDSVRLLPSSCPILKVNFTFSAGPVADVPVPLCSARTGPAVSRPATSNRITIGPRLISSIACSPPDRGGGSGMIPATPPTVQAGRLSGNLGEVSKRNFIFLLALFVAIGTVDRRGLAVSHRAAARVARDLERAHHSFLAAAIGPRRQLGIDADELGGPVPRVSDASARAATARPRGRWRCDRRAGPPRRTGRSPRPSAEADRRQNRTPPPCHAAVGNNPAGTRTRSTASAGPPRR